MWPRIIFPLSERWAGTTGDIVSFSVSLGTTTREQPEEYLLSPGWRTCPRALVSLNAKSSGSAMECPVLLLLTLQPRHYIREATKGHSSCSCFCRFLNSVCSEFSRKDSLTAHQNPMCLQVHVSYFHDALYSCSWQSPRKPNAPKSSLIYQGHLHAALIQTLALVL